MGIFIEIDRGKLHDHTFFDLTDTPSSSGSGGKHVRVRLDETGLEYVTISGGVSMNDINSAIATFSGTIDHDTILNTHNLTSDIDHGNISGLSDDDHTQYHTDARGDAKYYTKSQIATISGVLSAEIDSDIGAHESGSSHDSRYYTETELDAGQLDNRYYTETEVDTISGSLSSEINSDITAHSSSADHDGRYYTETELDAGQLDNRYYTETEVDTWRNSTTQTEMGYVNGVTSDIQTQLNDRYTESEVNTISGVLSAEIDSDITTHSSSADHDSRYYTETELDAGQLDNRYYTETEVNTWRNSTTQTEMGYVAGVSSDIQTQLNTKGTMDDVIDDTTPQLGGDLDTNQKNIELQPVPTNDHEANGTIATMTVDANATGLMAALHMDTTGGWVEAVASGTTTMPCESLALEAGTGSKKVLMQGFVRDDTWTWTVGGLIYVSTVTGTLTQTAPAITGDQVQIIGFATHSDRMFFNPSPVLVEIV